VCVLFVVIRAVAETCQDFTRRDLLLLDSGGQYADGTTDVTRTIHLEEATNRQVAGVCCSQCSHHSRCSRQRIIEWMFVLSVLVFSCLD
jgi:hypothetical protein